MTFDLTYGPKAWVLYKLRWKEGMRRERVADAEITLGNAIDRLANLRAERAKSAASLAEAEAETSGCENALK